MFEETAHNFGEVARGDKLKRYFALKNIYVEDVRIDSIRSSGWISARVTKLLLKTGEKAEIVAEVDTGPCPQTREGRITVVFDRPFYAQVDLRICWSACADTAESYRATKESTDKTRRRNQIVDAIDVAKRSVVRIEGRKEGRENGTPRRRDTVGSGVVIDQRGYILTNHHLVDGFTRLSVTLADGTLLDGRLVGRDPASNLAIVEVDSPDTLPVIQGGLSKNLRVGQDVITIGAGYGRDYTVTRGVISALDRKVSLDNVREYTGLIQTVAAIPPGSAGGPLANLDGELIGVNVHVRVGAQGIGFAVPSDTALAVASRLIARLSK